MSNCSAVLDFTPGQGYLLHYAVQGNVPSVGFCLSEEHKARLEMQLLSLTLQDMCTEGSESYEPRLDQLLKEHGDAEGLPTPTKSAPQKPKSKAKSKANAAKKRARKPRTADSEQGDSEDDGCQPEEDEEQDTPEQKDGVGGAKPPPEAADPAEAKLLSVLNRLNAGAAGAK